MTREKAWSGRFSTLPSADMERYSTSLAEDALLVHEDVVGSIAHARGLERAGVLSPDEARALVDGLRALLAAFRDGSVRLEEGVHEDVHMGVEALLKARVGAVAGKLHTARSRNDQVATDLRLWTRARLLDLADALLAFSETALVLAERHADVPMPGFTHLQPAQPVTFGHWAHAHAVRAVRDADRALDAFRRANVSPLGAGALAGTSFPLDPEWTARALGFDGAFENSLDAVSDRDFAVEATSAAALVMTHLSGLSEELVAWSSPAFGFVTLPEAYTTGSSIMPQKRNPDAAEITRGRAGRVTGDLVALLATLKSLPFAYNRDLQEAKAPLLHALPATVDAVRVLTEVVRGLEPRAERLRAALAHGFPEATELADHLARRGVPFREAHHVVGALVAEAERAGVPLVELPGLRARHPALADLPDAALDPARVPALKTTRGGTAPERVREAVARARDASDALRERASAARARVDAAERALLEG